MVLKGQSLDVQGRRHARREEQRNLTCPPWRLQLSIALGHLWESTSCPLLAVIIEGLSFLFIVLGQSSHLVLAGAGKWKGPGSGRWELPLLPETVMESPGGGVPPPPTSAPLWIEIEHIRT